MDIIGNHTVVVGDWLVDVDIIAYSDGHAPDLRHDSVDPGEDGECVYNVLSAAAVCRNKGGDMSLLDDEGVLEAIQEQLVCH
jgi:hypothetical protein